MNILVFVTSAQLQQQNFEKNSNKKYTPNRTISKQKVKIQLPTYAPSLLQEIEDFIEESAKHCNKLET
jgi:hypothetical protein